MGRIFRWELLCLVLSIGLSYHRSSNATCPGDESCCIGNGSFNAACVDAACPRGTFFDQNQLPTTCESGNQCHTGGSCTPTISRNKYVIDGDSDLGGTLEVELRTFNRNIYEVNRGTILFGSGGDGTAFLSDDAGIAKLMNELSAIGFTVVDRRWTTGWTATDFGNRLEASRYATLVRWLQYQYRCGDFSPAPFIAVGHSSGAAEVAYALTTYGMEPYIDLAILSSGPPEAALDLECTHEEDSCAATWCDDLFCAYQPSGNQWTGGNMCAMDETYCMDARPPCAFSTSDLAQNTPSCGDYTTGEEHTTYCDPVGAANYLKVNSVLWAADPNTLDDFPRTTIHSILGTMDSSQGPVGSLQLYDQLDSRKRLWIIENGNHNWFGGASANGRRALKFAIEYFTRPWIGDTNYDGDVDVDDYTELRNLVLGGGSNDACPTVPVPGGSVEKDFDVNNDGDVNSADLDIVAELAGCSSGTPNSCTSPISLKTCDSPSGSVFNTTSYPTPGSDSGEPAVDCAGDAPMSCEIACAWCTE